MPAEVVRAAWQAGARVFGENRVQEAEAKIRQLAGLDGATWHLVGHLQSNKAGKVVGLFDLIHSVDDAELLRALGRRAVAAGVTQGILLQVNCSGEASKSGCAPDDAVALARLAHDTPGLALRGFMTIGPLEPADPDVALAGARRAFRRLRELRQAAEQAVGTMLPELSMGMTDDLEVAIEEGATLVRVGTAIFGSRRAAG